MLESASLLCLEFNWEAGGMWFWANAVQNRKVIHYRRISFDIVTLERIFLYGREQFCGRLHSQLAGISGVAIKSRQHFHLEHYYEVYYALTKSFFFFRPPPWWYFERRSVHMPCITKLHLLYVRNDSARYCHEAKQKYRIGRLILYLYFGRTATSILNYKFRIVII